MSLLAALLHRQTSWAMSREYSLSNAYIHHFRQRSRSRLQTNTRFVERLHRNRIYTQDLL